MTSSESAEAASVSGAVPAAVAGAAVSERELSDRQSARIAIAHNSVAAAVSGGIRRAQGIVRIVVTRSQARNARPELSHSLISQKKGSTRFR